MTCNGGNVLINGAVDYEWNQKVLDNIKHNCLPAKEILAKFQEIMHEKWILNGRYVEGLFHYFVINRDELPQDELISFAKWAESNCWKVSLQGRKVYLVPEVLNKEAAVSYIRDLENESRVIASGDSLLDLGMLEFADYAIAPRHGEIYQTYLAGNLPKTMIEFTASSGILCAEEILEAVS